MKTGSFKVEPAPDTDGDDDVAPGCIVLGDGAIAYRSGEFVLKTSVCELRTILTRDEHAVIFGVLRRAVDAARLVGEVGPSNALH